ncbi:hypothetical protein O1611_g4570 [Lasiodiplodia mahajangana]|uniref:Uncharacterized protein n=1 Tax=Lasiodiplodia mahajangana TaxID=1108764 RepID=A0ACC2JNH7_9PEZI|nr:hypothetical protein O1611_g4570 [Lasiodiplodia mahajangana]
MRELWSAYEAATYQRITFQVISEGQATALYVCEPFSDPSSTFDRPQLWANFLDLEQQSGLNIVVADHGSSTLVQSLYYDGDGRLTNSQSNCGPDWQPGAIGGSHSCNDAIRHLIRTQLAPHLPLTQVALLMRRFEEEKGRLDPDNLPVGLNGNPQPLRLIGTDPRFNVILSPYDIQSAYHTAFNKSLRVFRREIGRLLALGKDFAVVFCGGSYHSPWLHRVVAQYMEKVKNDAAIGEKPFRVRYAFLTDQDSTWPSAVSAGAALSATRLPHPTRVINASAIALQLVRLSRGETDWVPSSKARFLLAKGCIEPQRVRHRLLDPGRVIFRLVCDPSNDKRPDALRYKTKGKTRCFRPIRIGSPHRVLNGPLSVYDLGFEVDGREVPPGRIMFVLFSRQANRLATSERTPVVKNELLPNQIDDQSNKLKNALDKRWELTLVTDPASKLLTVDCDGCYDNNPAEAPHYGHGNFLKTLVADGYY